jgi:hypothetical protein
LSVASEEFAAALSSIERAKKTDTKSEKNKKFVQISDDYGSFHILKKYIIPAKCNGFHFIQCVLSDID